MGGMVTTVHSGGKRSKRSGVGIKAKNNSTFTKAINQKGKRKKSFGIKAKNNSSFTKALNGRK
jgi:hypothetical protein